MIQKSQRQWWPLGLFFLIGWVMALIWLVTSARAWPALQVDRQLRRGQTVSVERIEAVLERARHSERALLAGPQVHMSTLLFSELYGVQRRAGDPSAMFAAGGREAAQNALAREPASGPTWARLAFFEYLLEGPSLRVVDALRLSIYTAPAHSHLLFWRLGLLARNRAFWNSQIEELIRGQMLLAWQMNPRRLADTAARHGLTDLTRLALSATPEILERFEALLPADPQPH